MPRMSGLQFIFAYKKKKEAVIRTIDNDLISTTWLSKMPERLLRSCKNNYR